jgi:hypothetical protein
MQSYSLIDDIGMVGEVVKQLTTKHHPIGYVIL